MIAAAIGYATLKLFTDLAFPFTLLAVVAWTTICWVVVTFTTRPEPDEHLVAFYRRTQPDGPGWTRIAALAGEPAPGGLQSLFVDWIAGVVLVYSVLFGLGNALLGSPAAAVGCFIGTAAAAAVLWRRAR
jgi:hypothetical protein